MQVESAWLKRKVGQIWKLRVQLSKANQKIPLKKLSTTNPKQISASPDDISNTVVRRLPFLFTNRNIHSQNNCNTILKKSEFATLTDQFYILLLLPIQYKTVLLLLNYVSNLTLS